MTNIPAAGRVGVLDYRNPTLLPNFDKPVATGSNVGLQSPAAYLAANPRGNASATATIGGSVTTGDILTLELLNNLFPGGAISHTYTTVAGDTVGTIAEAFAKLFNDDAAALGFGVEVDAGGASGAVLTFNHNGPVGNFSTLSVPAEETAKITAGGTALTGDVMAVLFSGPAFATVAPATDTATISGTPAATDTLPLVFTNSGVASLPVTVTYTVVAGDTVNSIATNLAAAVNANATLQSAAITATASDGVITISHNGAIGNNTTLSCTPTHGGGGSEAITFANSGALSGGLGVPGSAGVLVTANSTTGNTTTQQATALKNAINASAALAALSVTATSSAAVVTINVPATAEPATLSTWVNTITPTATIGGSIAAGGGDVLTLTVTNAAIAGGAQTISYTTVAGDTATTIATAMTALINSNQALEDAVIEATSAAAVITFTYPGSVGQLRLTESVTTGSETITLTTTPTDTLTLASNATETFTLSPTTGILSGGTGPVVATNNFQFASANSQVQAFFYGNPYSLDFNQVSALVAQGQPII